MRRANTRIPLLFLYLALFVCLGCDTDLQSEHAQTQVQDQQPDVPETPQDDQTTDPPPDTQTPDTPADIAQDTPTEVEPLPDIPEDAPIVEQPTDEDKPIVEPPTGEDKPIVEQPGIPDRPFPQLPDPDPETISAAIPIEAEGLPNLFQVSPELYRSAQPVESGLTAAKNLGIQAVLSLQLVSFDPTFEATEQTGLTLEHVPMIPWNVTETELLQALEVIRDAPKPILVHCLHGADRTGLVIAMYRIIFQNWSIQDAKDEMTSDTFGYHEEFANLPELLEQIDFEDMRSKLF